MTPQHYTTNDLQHQQQINASNLGFSATLSGLNTSSIGSPMPPLYTWVPPSAQELQFYDKLFVYVDNQGRNAISGQQAVAFFLQSHVDKAILREIWAIADSQQKSELSRNEFYVAMRLISMAQHGDQVSLPRFYQLAARQYPFPIIESVIHSQGGQSTVIQTQAQAQVHAQHQDARGVYHENALNSEAPYALRPDEKQKYDIVFQQYDTDHDGFLMGTEAVALFQMSGLNRNILRDIWSMADVTQDSKLSIQEFYVAMHLIVCVSKRGLPMPPTLPRELGTAAFGAGETGPVGSHVTEFPSQRGLLRQQQESLLPPEHEGVSAFDSLSTTGDAPLSSLPLATLRSSRKDFSNHATANTRNSQLGDFNEPPVPTPTGSGKQHDSNSFPPSGALSVIGRDRTNSGSSLSSMSSFNGLTPLPSQEPMHQLPPHNLASNDGVQTQPDNPSFHAFSTLGGIGFRRPVASSDKPFMGDEEEKKLVGKLDEQNQEVVQAVASVERKQSTIEMALEKLRDLDELRHELVTLVMKRGEMRAASICTYELIHNSAEEQTRHALERSLRSLVGNQKLLVHQLQRDISRYDGELEEVILSAKLQQRLSIESPSPLINVATPPVPAHDSSRGTTAFTGTPLILDGSNALPSPVAIPSSPSIFAFSPDATDSSGFNAFSNFDSAPQSLASATPSPAGAVVIPSGTSFSPALSPTQSANGKDTFNVICDFSAGAVPSVLPGVGSAPGHSPFSPTSSPSVVNTSAGFDGSNAAAPLAAANAGLTSSPPPAADATSPFSPFSPSPSPTVTDHGGLSGFGDFKAASSSLPAAAATSSPAVAASSSTDFSWEPSPSDIVAHVTFSTSAHESSPFALTPSPAATRTPVFDAFAHALLSDGDTTTSASSTVVTENLMISPVAADNNGLNACGDFDAATGNAVESSELVSKQESTGDLLFSPTPSPVATSFDTFGDFSVPPTLGNSAASVHASEKTADNLPFSPVAADGTDFTYNFGNFNAAPASTDGISSLPASEQPTKASPFSPVFAKDDAATVFGDFSAAPASAARPSEPLKTTDSNGSSPLMSVIAGSTDSRDVSDLNLTPVVINSTKSVVGSDNSLLFGI